MSVLNTSFLSSEELGFRNKAESLDKHTKVQDWLLGDRTRSAVRGRPLGGSIDLDDLLSCYPSSESWAPHRVSLHSAAGQGHDVLCTSGLPLVLRVLGPKVSTTMQALAVTFSMALGEAVGPE